MLDQDDADRKDEHNADVTPVDKISIEHFAPPSDLVPYVWQFYHFRCKETKVQGSQPRSDIRLSC